MKKTKKWSVIAAISAAASHMEDVMGELEKAKAHGPLGTVVCWLEDRILQTAYSVRSWGGVIAEDGTSPYREEALSKAVIHLRNRVRQLQIEIAPPPKRAFGNGGDELSCPMKRKALRRACSKLLHVVEHRDKRKRKAKSSR